MNVVWTRHAEERQRAWEKKRDVTREEVEELVRNPHQVLPGRRNAQVAQVRRGNGVLRVPFVEEGENRVVLTLYWSSKVDKYWKRSSDEGNL